MNTRPWSLSKQKVTFPKVVYIALFFLKSKLQTSALSTFESFVCITQKKEKFRNCSCKKFLLSIKMKERSEKKPDPFKW